MLDDLMPHPDFSERHHRVVAATPERTWRALAALRIDDLTVTGPLMALRHLTRQARSSGPLLTDGPLTPLHRDEGVLAIAGAVAQPWRPAAPRRAISTLAEFQAFAEPGWTKYLTEFRVDPRGDACVLLTETRGVSTDASARRRFRLYWFLIRIPSGIVRRDVLRAVARSAGAGEDAPG